MNVKDVMSSNPVCRTPETGLQEIARLMGDRDCGEIPIIADEMTKRVVGVVTDRDITCRTVAQGKNPLELRARDCMSTTVVTVEPNMSLEECCRLMESKQIRRVPVVADSGACVGIVSQADIARHAPSRQTAEVVAEISRPVARASA